MPKKHLKSLTALAAATVGIAVAISGCSGPATEPQSTAAAATTLDELYKQAVDAKQTTVTIYGPTESSFKPVYDEFTKRFPNINVKSEFLFGGDLRTRVDQEVATERHVGDLIHLDDAVNYLDDAQNIDLVGVKDAPDGVVQFDGKIHVPSLSLFTMIYNTDKLSAAQVPQSWRDVAGNSSLSGALGMSDPTSLAATSTSLYTAYTNGAIDDGWLTAVAGSAPRIYKTTSQMVGALATGEISFAPVGYYGFVVTQKALGAHLSYVIPKDGAVLTDDPYLALKGGPSPLAAQLLVSWMLSPEGQAAIATHASEYGTMPGAPAPSGLPALNDVKRFPQVPAEKRKDFKQEAVNKMKEHF